MTKNEILNFALESGFIVHEFQGRQWIREPHTGCDLDRYIVKFFELVIQAERNRLADELQKMPLNDTANSIAIWIRNQE